MIENVPAKRDGTEPAKRGPKTGNSRLAMTEERRDLFLTTLRSSGGNFSHAAAQASPNSLAKPRSKPGVASFKALMARDAEFSAAVAETLEHVKDDVFAEIYRRAMEGTKEAVIQKGEQAVMATGEPAWITRYDNRLLLRLAAKLDPSWSETRNIQYSGTVEHKVMTMEEMESMSPEDLDLIDRALAVVGGAPKVIEHKPELPVIDVADEDEDTLAILNALEED